MGEDEPVLESEHAKNVDDWSPDGRFVVYDTGGGAGAEAANDLWVAPLDGDRKPIPFLVRPFTDTQAQISPDGRFIAYSSNESGTQEVYVMDFPKPTGKWKVSTEGGAEPQWRRDGRELFYLGGRPRKLMAVDVRAVGATFQAGVPRALFEANLDPRTTVRNRYVVEPGRPAVPDHRPGRAGRPHAAHGRPQLAVGAFFTDRRVRHSDGEIAEHRLRSSAGRRKRCPSRPADRSRCACKPDDTRARPGGRREDLRLTRK